VLNACEADAEDMASVARSKGFTVTELLTRAATRGRLTAELARAARELRSGDILLLSYSGHGGQVPDLNGDEPDGQDETWCLYDGQLIDDELCAALAQFAKGVRVLVLSDSCHSGTVVKMAYYHGTMAARGSETPGEQARPRCMPPDVAERTYRGNRAFYDRILKDSRRRTRKTSVAASVLLISGCQDNQTSADGPANGLFTGTLLKVWNHGRFKGDYRSFHKQIVRRMPPVQTPNYFTTGTSNPAFEAQAPFTI
jgi:hypothetical protein